MLWLFCTAHLGVTRTTGILTAFRRCVPTWRLCVVQVDCDANEHLCDEDRWDLDGFPTIKVVRGQIIHDYNGLRSADAIATFMREVATFDSDDESDSEVSILFCVCLFSVLTSASVFVRGLSFLPRVRECRFVGRRGTPAVVLANVE